MRESKIVLTRRLQEEGRWNEASAFKDEVIRELKSSGVAYGAVAKEQAWEEMARFYPPLPPAEPAESGGEEEDGTVGEDPSVVESAVDAMLEQVEESAGPLDLFGDIRWVYSQLENKRVRPEQAPSAGAWSLLAWARKYQSRFFEQLLPKALAKSPEDEEGVRREKRRVEEIEAMLEKLLEE